MIIRRVLPVVFLGAALTGLLALNASAQISNPSVKISSRVMAETENGGTTEALIVLTEKADLRPAALLQSKVEKGRFVVNALREVANRTQAPILHDLQARGIPYQSFYIANMIKITGGRAVMQELAARPDVASIEANPYVKALLPQANRGFFANEPNGIEWNVQRVKAPDVWALGFHGEGMVVAGADTGTQWDHPSMKNQYRGWNGTTVNFDYNWHDATSQHSPTPIDPHGHGTFTVSQMVGDDGQGNQIGVAPGAKWISCRNMDASGTGSPSTYAECFQFLIAPYPVGGDPNQGDPTKAPDSINNSWGCPTSEGCSANTLKDITDAVRAAGIFPAVAAGNSGSSCSTVTDPPSIYASSVTVGATTSTNAIASFSSRGPVTVDGSNRIKPNISAPGQNIRGAVPGNGYQSGWSGTSMATPHVAAAVALLWQAKPGLVGNIDQTQTILSHSSNPAITQSFNQHCGITPGNLPNNIYGWGLLDILKAVQTP